MEHEPDDGKFIDGCVVCKRCCRIIEGRSGKTKAGLEPCNPKDVIGMR